MHFLLNKYFPGLSSLQATVSLCHPDLPCYWVPSFYRSPCKPALPSCFVDKTVVFGAGWGLLEARYLRPQLHPNPFNHLDRPSLPPGLLIHFLLDLLGQQAAMEVGAEEDHVEGLVPQPLED